jgi:hypothetical protein
MNYWEPVDGADPELAAAADGTSTDVQQHFPSARVVKSLNQLGYHELEEGRHPRGAPDRIAIGAAGDDRAAVRAVIRLIDRIGFDSVDAGRLENGLVLEPDGSPFAVTYSADELSNLIAQRSQTYDPAETSADIDSGTRVAPLLRVRRELEASGDARSRAATSRRSRPRSGRRGTG